MVDYGSHTSEREYGEDRWRNGKLERERERETR